MFEMALSLLGPKLDPDNRVRILRSSKDPGLAEYFEAMQVVGSTDIDIDGLVYIKLHDVNGVEKLTWLEEFAHALQLLTYGSIDLSSDQRERNGRELEVAECLFNNASRLRLSPSEREDCASRINLFGGRS